MNIKKCNKCGWEYPGEYKPRKCKYCGTRFTMGICVYCHQWSDVLDSINRCRACKNKHNIEWARNKRNEADKAYNDWIKKIASIPKPYTTLTEEQWLEACKHFGACAYCNNRGIDARSMFIPCKYGGRYCDWNIVPACEKCETSSKLTENPFKRMDQRILRGADNVTKKLGYSRENLQRIVDYLDSKIKAGGKK